jgi:hypothetical protein
MTERHTIFTKPSLTREPTWSTVNREGGGTVHPTLGGECRVFPGMTHWGSALAGSAR